MPLDDLVGGRARPASRSVPPTARGSVSRAPASASAFLEVVLENYSSFASFQVPAAHWEPRVVPGPPISVMLPAVGDPCLVTFDDNGDAWLQWGPA